MREVVYVIQKAMLLALLDVAASAESETLIVDNRLLVFHLGRACMLSARYGASGTPWLLLRKYDGSG